MEFNMAPAIPMAYESAGMVNDYSIRNKLYLKKETGEK